MHINKWFSFSASALLQVVGGQRALVVAVPQARLLSDTQQALGAGVCYTFSIYSPAIKANLQLSQTDLQAVCSAAHTRMQASSVHTRACTGGLGSACWRLLCLGPWAAL